MPLLHEIITQQAQNSSLADKPALQFEDQSPLTYKQLEERSNQMARFLLETGVKPGHQVPVLLPPSLEHPIILLALSKIGATYIPIDPHFKCPTERINKILEDCKPKIIITNDSIIQQRKLDIKALTIQIDTYLAQAEIDKQEVSFPAFSLPIPPDPDVFKIYTSGTTGIPKGVPIGHGGLWEWYEVLKQSITGDRSVAGIISPAFDASIWEYLMAWSTGGKLHLAGQKTRDDLNEVVKFIETQHITDVTLIPAQIKALDNLQQTLQNLKSSGLKSVYSTGEACTPDIVQLFAECDIDFWNCYGPTEATFGISIIKVILDQIKDGKIPIGLPNSDKIKIHLLNEQLQPVPDGEKGILYIESPYLPKGYPNRERETAENFITITKADGIAVKVYKTNDVFTKEQNHLYYHGRSNDNRAFKINGILVNLNEVEDVLSKHPAIKDVAVVAVINDQGQTRLVAFIITHDAQTINPAVLSQTLQNNLISIAIPRHIKYTDEFPLTINGKRDYNKLKEEAYEIWQNAYQDIPQHLPRTPLEKELSVLWKSKLGISSNQPIGIQITFAEFGGDSLSANTLINAINKQFSIHATTADLEKFGFSAVENQGLRFTIANLAKYIRHKRLESCPGVSVNLLADSTSKKRPIFLIPPITGEGSSTYKKFAKELHANLDTKIYALNASGLDNKFDIHANIEELAQDFAAAINKEQPEGKIILLGWSFGGTLAQKIAEILEKQNRKIKFVGMIDTLAPAAYQQMSLEKFAAEIYALANNLCQILQEKNIQISLKTSPALLESESKEQQIEIVFNELLQHFKENSSIYNWLMITKINMLSNLTYKPKIIKGSHLLSTDATEKKHGDYFLGWARGNITPSSPLSGDHFSIMNNAEDLTGLVSEVTDIVTDKLGHTPPNSDIDTSGSSPPESFEYLLNGLAQLMAVTQNLQHLQSLSQINTPGRNAQFPPLPAGSNFQPLMKSN